MLVNALLFLRFEASRAVRTHYDEQRESLLKIGFTPPSHRPDPSFTTANWLLFTEKQPLRRIHSIIANRDVATHSRSDLLLALPIPVYFVLPCCTDSWASLNFLHDSQLGSLQ